MYESFSFLLSPLGTDDPMPEELSTFELGGDILSAEGVHLNEQQLHLNGQYQSHWQQQQQNVQVQGSNGLLENGDDLSCNNFDITPPMQTYTSVHQQQQAGGGVTHHHRPDSEALNNPAAQLVTQPKRMCARVDQSGRVKRHNPEPEALNNADTGKYINPFSHNTLYDFF